MSFEIMMAVSLLVAYGCGLWMGQITKEGKASRDLKPRLDALSRDIQSPDDV